MVRVPWFVEQNKMHPTYKRMLAGLEKKERTSLRKKTTAENRWGPATGGKNRDKWSLYILKCSDGSFYTGITNNLERRLKMHQDGKASRYTRTRGPVEMLYSETCGNRSGALIRECEVKEWPRTKKERLINKQEQISKTGTKRKAQSKNFVL